MNERTVEYSFSLRELAISGAKTVLDVGSGTTAFPALMRSCNVEVSAIDSSKKRNKYFPVIRDSILNPIKINGKKFDFITCISVLEHIVDYETAVKNMAYMLNPSGTLVMTFPYNEKEFNEDAYSMNGAEYRWKGNIARIYSREKIEGFCKYGITIDAQEIWQIFDGEYWAHGNRVEVPKIVTSSDKHQLMCVSYKNAKKQ